MCEKCDAVAHKLGLRDALHLEQVIMGDVVRKLEEHRMAAANSLNEEVRQSRLRKDEMCAGMQMVDKSIVNAIIRVLVTYTTTHCLDPLSVAIVLHDEFSSSFKRKEKESNPNLS